MSVPILHEDDVEALGLPGRQLSWLVARGGLQADHCSACMIRVAPGDKVRPAHAHPLGEEVIYIIRGTGRVLVAGEVSPVRAGSTVLFPRGAVHMLHNTGTEEMKVVCFFAPATGLAELRDARRRGLPGLNPERSVHEKDRGRDPCRVGAADRIVRGPTGPPHLEGLRRRHRQRALCDARPDHQGEREPARRRVWTYPTRDDFSYVFSPVIVDNLMYVLARNTALVALDATTGKEIWVHENLQGIAPRGINYWESRDRKDRRLLFQRNHQLEALDALTGKPILTFGKDGAVNLREGLRGRDPATIGRVQSSTPGKIFENLILLGSATGENYMSTPGDLRAYDVVTGKEVWRFRTIPHPGEFGYDTWPKDAYKYVGGTNTWGEITVDAARGIAYFPTGSPTYDYYGADRPGANLFGTSLVALDARTGKRLWHFQMVHHDLWDYDNCAAPQLTTIRRGGKTIDVVAQAGQDRLPLRVRSRDGRADLADRRASGAEERHPRRAGLADAAVPDDAAALCAQTLSPDDVNPYVLSPAEQDEWRKRIANARNQGLFTPPALIDTIAIPGANGGANWGNTAAHPTNGTVYVQSINVPSIYRLSLEEPGSCGRTRARRGARRPPSRRARRSTPSAARAVTDPTCAGPARCRRSST